MTTLNMLTQQVESLANHALVLPLVTIAVGLIVLIAILSVVKAASEAGDREAQHVAVNNGEDQALRRSARLRTATPSRNKNDIDALIFTKASANAVKAVPPASPKAETPKSPATRARTPSRSRAKVTIATEAVAPVSDTEGTAKTPRAQSASKTATRAPRSSRKSMSREAPVEEVAATPSRRVTRSSIKARQ